MTFQQKLRKFSKQQLWNEYCGYLDLNIKEYMYIQRRLMQEQIHLWCVSELGKSIYRADVPDSTEEFLQTMPLTSYESYADVLFRRDPDTLPEAPVIWIETTWEGGLRPIKIAPYTRRMLDSYKHRLRKAAAAFCAAAFLLGSVPAARAASVCLPPQVSAACAALIDGRTGQTLYEKDADRRALIASTTKIMTGLLVCEAGEADRRVTVPAAAVGLEGSSMYLKRGETLTRRDLLYGMMLHSGNDAALTLAISVSGSEQAFVRQMNLRAQALGLRQTHFANPHGLDSGENYSSARDLAMLAQAALQNQQFRTVVGTKTIACAGRTLTNHNKLLWRYDGCIGVKTGYTRHAGRILVSAAERGESQLIAVTLADPDDWRDHAALLDYGFAVLASQTPVYPQNRRIVWKNDCKKFWRAAPASPAARLRS